MYWIWAKLYIDGKCVSAYRYSRCYVRKSSADRAAKRMFQGRPEFEWVVSESNPWPDDGEGAAE